MAKFVFLGLLLVGSVASLDLIGRTQSAAVKGKLMCEGKPASGVKVKLMESDSKFRLSGSRKSPQNLSDSFAPGFLDSDDKMASGKSDSSGGFNLSGTSKELTGIEPYLAVFHDCKDGITVSHYWKGD